MTDELTCGKGLAENAALPRALAGVMAAIAENLELHMTSLVADDAATRREREAYERLAEEHRRLVSGLQRLADEMAACDDLPMGAHDEAATADPALLEAFERLVEREGELLALLQQRREGHEEMLAAWREEQGASSQ